MSKSIDFSNPDFAADRYRHAAVGYFEVILEGINGKFDLVLEGHVTLEHMIHEHHAETRLDKRELQALIQTSHDSLDAKISKVSAELKETRDDLSTKIEAVGDKVEGHEDRIRFLEKKAA